MKHYRVIYKPLYVARDNGEVEDAGGFYWIQKRTFLFWRDYEFVSTYASLSRKDAAFYRCRMLEAQHKIEHMKERFIVNE